MTVAETSNLCELRPSMQRSAARDFVLFGLCCKAVGRLSCASNTFQISSVSVKKQGYELKLIEPEWLEEQICAFW